MADALEKILARTPSWPKVARDELLRAAAKIEARHANPSAPYQATPSEIEAIDEGLQQLRRGELVPEDEMEALFDRDAP
jgi:predicted transcriptional regulator